MASQFDLLVEELASGGVFPEGAATEMTLPLSKAMRAGTLAATERSLRGMLADMDYYHEQVVRIGTPTRQQVIDAARARLNKSHMALKAMTADVIQSGQATAQQVIEAERRIHAMATDLDNLERYDPEAGPRAAPNSGLPDGVNVAAFKPKMMAAMKVGTITTLEACTAEARLLRGQAPDKDVIARVMG